MRGSQLSRLENIIYFLRVLFSKGIFLPLPALLTFSTYNGFPRKRIIIKKIKDKSLTLSISSKNFMGISLYKYVVINLKYILYSSNPIICIT